MLNTINIRSISAARRGITCKACGNPVIPGEDVIHIHTPKQPRGVYVHACCNVAHKSGTFTPAWYNGDEATRKATLQKRIATALQFKLTPTHPDTFPAWCIASCGVYSTPASKDGSVITWPRTVLNAHGTRDAVETIARAGDIIRYSVECGCYNDNGDVYRPTLSEAVRQALRDVDGIRAVEYRGNSVRVYADYNGITQATWVVYLVQDVLALARDGKGERVQLAHIRAHVEGRATWQRPERNKSIR